jgi:hypothetical protein
MQRGFHGGEGRQMRVDDDFDPAALVRFRCVPDCVVDSGALAERVLGVNLEAFLGKTGNNACSSEPSDGTSCFRAFPDYEVGFSKVLRSIPGPSSSKVILRCFFRVRSRSDRFWLLPVGFG